jgi:type I restriction enzyme, S subunit
MIQEKKISDFAEVITGGTPSTTKNEYWEGGAIPWLNSGELNKKFIYESKNFITELGLKNSSTRLMPPDTVLIALTGATCGLSALSKIEACANQSVTGILPSKSHIPEYLFHFLRTQRQRILDKAWGNAQPHISQAFVKDFVVPLPSIPEQLHIANLLTKAENLISQRKESIRLLDEYLKSTFLEMFGDPVRNEKGWEIVSLNDMVTKLGDGLHGTPEYSEDGEYYFINGNNLENGRIRITDTTKRVSEREFLKHKKDLNINTLLVSINGTLGRVAFYRNEKVILGKSACYFNLKSEEIIPLYLFHILQSPYFLNYATSKSTGSTISNVSLKTMRVLPIPYPPISLQTRFAKIAEKTETLKSQYKQSLKELENLYGSLSQKAFKGEFNI